MRYVLILLMFLLSSNLVLAEKKEPLEIDKEAWKASIEHLEYEPEQKKIAEKPDFEMPDLSWLKYVAYIAVGIIITLILVALLKNARPITDINSERIEAQSLEEAEENLPEVMLNQIFEEALSQQEFKKALRIKFLMVLQSLIDAKMIIWKKRKTNEQYTRELADPEILGKFRSVVFAFDDIWYGEVELTDDQFRVLVAGMDALNARINGG